MNKDDLFTSPQLKNKQFASLCDEKHIEHDSQFEYFLTPHKNSPFSLVHQSFGTPTPWKKDHYFNEGSLPMIDETPQKGRKIASTYLIESKVSFEPEVPEVEEQPIESECTPLKKTPPSESKTSPCILNTTAKKIYHLRFHESVTPRKIVRESERGLRVLSKLAYQIVLQQGPTTYKQVADRLIQDQEEDDRMDEKERQNIKRRVYDALNVLIALGELEKKNRKIVKSKKREKKEEEQQKMIEAKLKTLKKLKKKTQNLKRKKHEKQRIAKIHKSLRFVINRNKKLQTENSIQNKLPFPLIFTSFQLSNCIMNNETIQCSSENHEKLLGDTDVISFLPINTCK